MNALNKKGIQFTNFLTTDMKSKLGSIGRGVREKTIGVCQNIGNVRGLYPHIAQEITFRLNGDSNLVTGTERTNVIHTLGFYSEIGMTLVILAEKGNLGVTSNVHILGSFRHKINQR